VIHDLNTTRSGIGESPVGISPSKSLESQISTPFDDLIPRSEEPGTQYYLDAMRIYLALCSGSISPEAALKAAEILRASPEYTTFPTNPAMIPISDTYRAKILENLKTLKKFNLITRDSIRSAYSFAFLTDEAPLSDTDQQALKIFSENPSASLMEAAHALNLTPRTVARSLERLRQKHSLRFTALVDFSAFNLQSIVVFFTLKEGVDWAALEQNLARYPFTKSLLKTTMTDLGYVTFLVPNFDENRALFQSSLRDVLGEFFEYASPHYQMGAGVITHLDLYREGTWELPRFSPKDIRGGGDFEDPPLLVCRDADNELTKNDLAVATHLQIDFRAPPSKTSSSLAIRGYDIDARRVGQSEKKLENKGLFLPYTLFGGIGLSSNFCFEIVCSNEWRERIPRIVAQFPWSIFYTSNRGVIVWTKTPGSHQVDYYRMFRDLEQNPGVELVHPIMTIVQGGSRSLLDLTRTYSYEEGRWTFDVDSIDMRNYLL
jgi:DNA-binding Lrp family transcriptional regulator